MAGDDCRLETQVANGSVGGQLSASGDDPKWTAAIRQSQALIEAIAGTVIMPRLCRDGLLELDGMSRRRAGDILESINSR